MKRLQRIRRILILASTMALGAALGQMTHAAGLDGIVVHGADETRRDWCSTDTEGRLWLHLPNGGRMELVSSIDDPAITWRGDGSFHPFDAGEIRAALEAVRFPLGGVRVEVFVLPLPRRAGFASAASPGLILLSPGVLPLSREHQHSEFVHELGHAVQYELMPDADVAGWNAYRELRGIEDAEVYNAWAAHANRPHEIFAEDFRALFGGSLANYSGTIENAGLEHPANVPGLEDFMLGLADGAANANDHALHVSRAPGSIRFSGPATRAPLDVFDLLGRRIATLDPFALGDGAEWRWDGRDRDGRSAMRGVYFARVRGTAATARVTLTP